MASKQSQAVRELYAGWTRTRLVGEAQDNEQSGGQAGLVRRPRC